MVSEGNEAVARPAEVERATMGGSRSVFGGGAKPLHRGAHREPGVTVWLRRGEFGRALSNEAAGRPFPLARRAADLGKGGLDLDQIGHR